MSNIQGALIIWVNKSSVDFNNVKDQDYTLVKVGECSRDDGEPIELPDGYEWLASFTELQPDYDSRIFILNQDTRATNVAHPDWPNYNMYLTKYNLVKRDIISITQSIRQEEALANASLLSEAENSKLNYFATGAALKLAQSLPLSAAEQNAILRHADVQMKMSKNAANAELLISKVQNNENVDISSGWEYDNIESGGFPFSY